jgi:hypothetical protein
VSEAGQHGSFQLCRQIVLQHYPNEMFRVEAGKGVQEEHLVGSLSTDRVEEESSPA